MARSTLSACLVLALLAALGCGQTPKVAPGPTPPVPPDLSADTPEPEPEPPAVEYFVYHLRRGDTLYSLEKRFTVPWAEIARTNDVRDHSKLIIGQAMLIRREPGVKVPPLAPAPPPGAVSAPRSSVPRSDLHRGRPQAGIWWPTRGTVTRQFGTPLRGLPEPGVGIRAPAGTDVHAVGAGTVITSIANGSRSPSPWAGVVAISHPGGMVSWYACLDRVLVRKGAKVAQGQALGTVGPTGTGRGPELALRIYRNDRIADPTGLLP